MMPVTSSLWRKWLASSLIRHSAGIAMLVLLNIALIVWLGIDLTNTGGTIVHAVVGKEVELKALSAETLPLRGLDKQVVNTREQINAFYANRIPSDYSAIATRIGEIELKSGVRLLQVQYSQGPGGGDLTEISMDAGIGGDYSQIMHFVNGLERDQDFFVIRGMTLTGQQSGLVSLRLGVSTWLHAVDAASSGLPPTAKTAASPSGPSISATEGR
jgi:hypothetical protein